MEEEKTVNLEELIELLNEPIEIKSKTLGILNFRRIYNDDYLFIENCLNEEMDREMFCKQFLINQICDPLLTLDNFNDVDEDELRLILKKYIEIENLTDYFDFDSSKDIFTIFNEGMESYRNYVNSIVMNHHLSLLKTANSLINSFNFHESLFSYLNVVNEMSIGAMSDTAKVLTGTAQIAIPDIGSHVSQMINSSAVLSAVNMGEIVNQQTTIWRNWIRANSFFLNQITRDIALFWDNLQINYQIPSLDAQKCLKKYNWFISPNMGIPIVYEIMKVCNSSSNHKQKEINNIFINYFLDDDYKRLDMMVGKWSANPLFKRRIKIIKDCVNIMKVSGNEINYSNFVVPTLISQIEGIQHEFMEMNGILINRDGFFDSDGKYVNKKNYFRQLTSDNEFYDAMNDVFLDILFQKAYHGEKCTSLHFSRHKILHGEITNYGQKDFTVRCFMILDFLSELMFINNEESV